MLCYRTSQVSLPTIASLLALLIPVDDTIVEPLTSDVLSGITCEALVNHNGMSPSGKPRESSVNPDWYP